MTYFAATFAFWVIYLFVMRFYTHNILSSLYNYAMILVAEDLQRVLKERAENRDDSSAGFDTDENDEWLFL